MVAKLFRLWNHLLAHGAAMWIISAKLLPVPFRSVPFRSVPFRVLYLPHRDVNKETDENIKVDCNVKSILQLTMSWSYPVYISHSKVEVYKECQGMT